MATFNIQKAITYNRGRAHIVGWPKREAQVLSLLGYEMECPGEMEFAEAVYGWQQMRPPLVPDGKLGPLTWARMRPETAFTPGGGLRPLPWLPSGGISKTQDYVSYYHGTSRKMAEQLMDQKIEPWFVDWMRIMAPEAYKDYTDFGKGFYLFDERGRRNAFGRAKRRNPDWAVVEFQLTRAEDQKFRTASALLFGDKSARPGNAPVLPNSFKKPANWLQFVEWNRHVGRGPDGYYILRPGDEDWTIRFGIMIGPLWVPKDSGIDEGPPPRTDNLHQYNVGQGGLHILNGSACMARRVLHHDVKALTP